MALGNIPYGPSEGSVTQPAVKIGRCVRCGALQQKKVEVVVVMMMNISVMIVIP